MTPQQTIETDGWSFVDWIQANTRAIGIGAAVVAAAGLGFWFYMRSGEIKRLNAERGLNQAKQSMAAGNLPLAQTDLQRIAQRYKGTPAGVQSAMLLAQIRYEDGKHAEGLTILEPYQNSRASGQNLAAVWSLSADGLMAQGKAAEAAAAYQKAADATRLAGEKALYQAKTARALMAAGKNEEARRIWQELATNPDAAVVRNEAEVRLGELSARPVGS